MNDPDTVPGGTRTSGRRHSKQTALAAVRAVWARARPVTLERVAVLEDLAADALAGEVRPERRAEAQRVAHQLAGSLGTFGIMRASDLAREVEMLLAGPLPPQEAPRLAELVVGIRRLIEADEAEVRDEEVASTSGETVLVLSPDTPQAGALVVELADRGHGVRRSSDVAEARTELARQPAAVVVADLDGDPAEVQALIAELLASPRPPAVLVLADDDRAGARVEAARLGVTAFLGRHATVAEITDAAAQALARRSATEGSVVVVDDDPAVLEFVAALLDTAGFEAVGVSDPLRLWEALDDAGPDLVILDLDMPGARGSELCRALRADPRWAALPVLFLTALQGDQAVEEVFAAGADDFIPKPVVGPELILRIRNRIERMRLYRERFEIDAVTGLISRAKAEEQIHQVLAAARDRGAPAAFAILDLDRFKQLNDLRGNATGDEVLRRLGTLARNMVRHDDVVARWGGEEFVVALPGLDRVGGVERIEALLARWRDTPLPARDGSTFTTSFSAGVAAFPDDAADVSGLYRAADAALRRAKAAGRGRVLPAGWRAAEGEGRLDVLVVDDDALTTELLTRSLTDRGLQVTALADGRQAADALTGPQPDLSARVVLLDLDLPGLDGLAVLRLLVADGRLGETRVIMLTARTDEAFVVETLRLGAFDHVAKPFSIPVLLQRVERALQER